jgi:hypothetical protein
MHNISVHVLAGPSSLTVADIKGNVDATRDIIFFQYSKDRRNAVPLIADREENLMRVFRCVH